MIRRFSFYLSLFLVFVHSLQAIGDYCSQIKGFKDLNFKDYSGVWHVIGEISSEDDLRYEPSCTQTSYTVLNIGDSLQIRLNITAKMKLANEWGSMYGIANVTDESSFSDAYVKFTIGRSTKNIRYTIMDTDYKGYSLVKTCFNDYNFNKKETTLIMSRLRQASDDIMNSIKAILRKYSLDPSKIVYVDQVSCN